MGTAPCGAIPCASSIEYGLTQSTSFPFAATRDTLLPDQLLEKRAAILESDHTAARDAAATRGIVDDTAVWRNAEYGCVLIGVAWRAENREFARVDTHRLFGDPDIVYPKVTVFHFQPQPDDKLRTIRQVPSLVPGDAR